ncbi:MAG: helix-turn-helix domain-containing protein [archaeon]
MDIEKIISSGESETLEFKESLALKDEIGEGVSSLSNTAGGLILVGVTDSREIIGVQIGKKTIEDLANYIKAHTDNHVFPKISVIEAEGKDIVVIVVKESDEKPVFFKGKAYIRVGKSRHRLSASEIRNLAKKSGKLVYWDELICENAALSDIDEEKVEWFLQRRRKVREAPKALDIEGILASVGGLAKGKLTNAGILFFGKNPEDFFLQARIHCVRFEGTDVSRNTSDDKLYSGAIWEQVELAEEFVRKNIKLHGFRTGYTFKRIDVPEYPPQAIREAIINALIHRDYEVPTEVKVFIFDDRIEITNPGTFPVGTTPDNPKHVPRNPILCQLMRDVEFIEKYGSGIYLIREECKRLNAPEPAYEIDKHWTKIVLKSAGIVGFIREIEKTGVKLNERQRQSIAYLFREGRITAKLYCELNNIVPDTANRDLNELLNMGLIKRVGRGRATYYVSIIG